MGKIFKEAPAYNSNPTGYSWPHWNEVVASAQNTVLDNLVAGNFYYFMNIFLDMQVPKEGPVHPWVSRRNLSKK